MTTVQAKTDLIKVAAMMMGGLLKAAPPEQKWIHEPNAKYFELLATARERGKPVVWGSFVTQPEIFWAMDMVPVMMEQFSGIATRYTGTNDYKYIDLAEAHFMSDHLCSLNKVLIGLALSGDIGKPDLVVHPANPCDSTRITYSAAAEVMGVPFFSIDMPLWKNERSYQYVADEFERLVAFLEEKTGRKLEYKKLRQVMEYSNQAHELYAKINDLKKLVPSPLGPLPAPPILNLAGTQDCVTFSERLYQIGKARAEKGQGFLPKEKVRVGWFSTGAGHDPQMGNWLEQEFGVSVVNTMLGVYPGPIEDLSSTRKIYEGLAKQLMVMPMTRECGGLAEDWIEYAVPVCKEYKMDAVFLTLNLGCKNAWALAKLLKDEIADKVGIPTFVLEVDILDGRFLSGESIRASMKDFLSTMLA